VPQTTDRTLASPSQAAAPPDARGEWAFLHLGFVLIGVSMTMLGPVLPYFTPPLEFDGRPGGAVFLDTIFREFSGHGGDQLAFAARGFLEGDQRRVFLFCSWFGVPWTWAWFFSTAFVAIYGLGYGLSNPSINLRATHLPSGNVAAAVSC